jgi:hypothetical protein
MAAGGGILPRVPRLHIPAVGREPRNPSMRPIKPQSQPPHPYTAPQQGEFSKSPSADTRGKREGGRRRSRKRGAPPRAVAAGDPGAAGSLRPAASAGFFPIPPAAIEAGVGRREEKWKETVAVAREGVGAATARGGCAEPWTPPPRSFRGCRGRRCTASASSALSLYRDAIFAILEPPEGGPKASTAMPRPEPRHYSASSSSRRDVALLCFFTVVAAASKDIR